MYHESTIYAGRSYWDVTNDPRYEVDVVNGTIVVTIDAVNDQYIAIGGIGVRGSRSNHPYTDDPTEGDYVLFESPDGVMFGRVVDEGGQLMADGSLVHPHGARSIRHPMSSIEHRVIRALSHGGVGPTCANADVRRWVIDTIAQTTADSPLYADVDRADVVERLFDTRAIAITLQQYMRIENTNDPSDLDDSVVFSAIRNGVR